MLKRSSKQPQKQYRLSLTIFLATIVLALPLFFADIVQAATLSAPAPGEKAPDFTLTDTTGKKHSLSEYKGRIVVLEWFNQRCPFVQKHYNSNNMQNLQKEYTRKGVVWLSICSSAPGKPGYFSPAEHNKMFAEKGAAPTAILLDPTGKVGHLYGATSTPDMYVINSAGVLVYSGAIDDTPDLEVGVDKAKSYVKAALDAALSGKSIATASTQSYGCSVKYQ